MGLVVKDKIGKEIELVEEKAILDLRRKIDEYFDIVNIDIESKKIIITGLKEYTLSFTKLLVMKYMQDNRCRIVSADEIVVKFNSTLNSVYQMIHEIRNLNSAIPIHLIGKRGYMWYAKYDE